MKINIEIGEAELRCLISNAIRRLIGEDFKESDIVIEVKSKQNYRAEWEPAEFRARATKNST